MIYLFLHVVLLSGFGIFLKDAENRGHRLDPIGLVNYATAFVFSCALASQTNSFTFTPLTLVFGLATGISYAFGFVLVVAGMRLSGIVVTTAVIGLSMILPILFSVIVWNEEPNLWQTLGILIALVALPLLSGTTKATQDTNRPTWYATPKIGLIVVVLLFLNAGVGRLAMKGFNEMCPMDQKPMYLFFLFIVTTVSYLFICLHKRQLPTILELGYGILIGVCNVLGSGTFIVALDQLDALIAFPISGSGGMLFTTTVGILILGEQLNKRLAVGVVLAIISLILVNLYF